jgi:hypothetical protein
MKGNVKEVHESTVRLGDMSRYYEDKGSDLEKLIITFSLFC